MKKYWNKINFSEYCVTVILMVRNNFRRFKITYYHKFSRLKKNVCNIYNITNDAI